MIGFHSLTAVHVHMLAHSTLSVAAKLSAKSNYDSVRSRHSSMCYEVCRNKAV